MSASVYVNDDVGYSAWLREHPNGLIANVAADGNPSYFHVHRSTCSLITPGRQRSNAPGAATARGYRKVASDSSAELLAWGAANGRRPDAMVRCRTCRPEVSLPFRVAKKESSSSDHQARGRRYWAVLAKPTTYNVEEAMGALEFDTWRMPTGDVRPGDRGLVWRARGRDGQRGVVGFFEVVSEPTEKESYAASAPFWLADRPRSPERRVKIRYVKTSVLPLWLDEHPTELAALSVSRGQGTHSYKVTPEQWAAVLALAGGWPSAWAGGEAEPELVDPPPREGKSGRGQGRQQSPAVRKAVEDRAMVVAASLFPEGDGWKVKDTSIGHPYDLECTRGSETLYVEVKGTTGLGEEVIVTEGEVKHAEQHPGQCVLVVVSQIKVDDLASETPTATGGNVRRVDDWRPREGSLEALTWRHVVPR